VNYKLLFGLLALVVVLLSSISPISLAQSTKGQPVTEIVWTASTQPEPALLQVAQGKADIFAHSVPLYRYEAIDPQYRQNLRLIRSASTYTDLALNPAANVIDPNAPGVVELVDQNLTGRQIPGLLVWDPPTNWVNWTDLGSTIPWSKVHFNPWAIREMRFALNFLIDRDLLVRKIFHGSAGTALGAIRPSHPWYDKAKKIYEELGLTPTGDKEKAQQMFFDALKKIRQVYQKYGMDLQLRDYSDAPAGKWLVFVKPDGSEEIVTVHFVIRVEDERLYIGRQIADWIEKYFYIKVNRIEKERSIVTPVIYGANPVQTSTALGGVVWSMYTEGWVSMGEDIDVYARYDVAFFYAPLRGYGPNHRITDYWYWFNKTMYELGIDLYYGTYTKETVNKLFANIAWMLKAGIEQSIRVFLTENYEYTAVNKDRVVSLIPGRASGFWTPWALRTITTTDGKLSIIELSSTGALFMSPWNNVLGFTDVYSELMGRQVRDFAFYSRPDNGMPQPIRVESYMVERGNFTIPSDAYVYDPVQDKWIHPKELTDQVAEYFYGKKPSTAPVKVVLNYKLGKFHDGTDITMADILYMFGFYWEWAFDDSQVTNKTDPYYDPEIDSAMSYFLSTIYGIKVINETAIEIYTPYDDIYDVLVASTVAMWADMPWDVMAAAEYLVTNRITPPGSNYPFGWTDREGECVGISFIDPDHTVKVKEALQTLQSQNYVPPYITTFPGITVDDVSTRYSRAIEFIDTYGHSMISNGPYYVESYDPSTNKLVMKYFEPYDEVYPRGYWTMKFKVVVPQLVDVKVPDIVIGAFDAEITVKLLQTAPEYKELSATGFKIFASIYRPEETGIVKIGDVPENAIIEVGGGTYKIRFGNELVAQFFNETGTYYLVLVIQHPESGTTLVRTLELTVIALTQTTTTTTTTPPPTGTETTTPPGATKTTTVTETIIEKTTVTEKKTVTETSPITTTVMVTNWAVTAVVGIVGLVIGILVMYFARPRKP